MKTMLQFACFLVETVHATYLVATWAAFTAEFVIAVSSYMLMAAVAVRSCYVGEGCIDLDAENNDVSGDAIWHPPNILHDKKFVRIMQRRARRVA